jgi:C-terminal binding protein
MSKVFITDGIDDPQIEKSILGDYLSDRLSPKTEILINWNERITSSYLDQVTQLKAVIRCGVGYDHIDIQECKQRNIVVCNDPDYCTEEVSNTAVAMILNGTRKISQYNEICRTAINKWQDNVQTDVIRDSDLTIGIIGLGRIGKSTLKKCQILGFKTIFYDPYVAKNIEQELKITRKKHLHDLIKSSDIISLHCPLTEETRGMVDQEFISLMRPHSMLVNTARGKLIKDLGVIESSLHNGNLSFVGLDVLPSEPPEKHSLIDAWIKGEEWLAGRLIINPHASFYSQQSVLEVRKKAAQNALGIIHGEQPRNNIFFTNSYL